MTTPNSAYFKIIGQMGIRMTCDILNGKIINDKTVSKNDYADTSEKEHTVSQWSSIGHEFL